MVADGGERGNPTSQIVGPAGLTATLAGQTATPAGFTATPAGPSATPAGLTATPAKTQSPQQTAGTTPSTKTALLEARRRAAVSAVETAL